jgi:hypothetical protein
MVVAPGDERSPCRAAQSGGVEAVVTQPLGRKLIHRGRRHAAAEGAELAEADVVDQDQDDVGRALRRLHRLRKLARVGVGVCPPHISREMEVGARKHAGRRRIGRLLCQRGHCAQAERDACEKCACQGVTAFHYVSPLTATYWTDGGFTRRADDWAAGRRGRPASRRTRSSRPRIAQMSPSARSPGAATMTRPNNTERAPARCRSPCAAGSRR